MSNWFGGNLNGEEPALCMEVRVDIAETSGVGSFRLSRINAATNNVLIDWGDGGYPEKITTTGSVTHTYSDSSKRYLVKIYAANPTHVFGDGTYITYNTVDQNKITQLISMGDIKYNGFGNLVSGSISGFFRNGKSMVGTHLKSSADLRNVDSLRQAFDSTNFDGNIGSWDTSNVTNMNTMFYNAQKFNNGGSDSIDSWDTGSVTNMSSTFSYAFEFNQPIGSWNTSNVTNMYQMFSMPYYKSNQSVPFNQDIGSWDVSNVTNMYQMFMYHQGFNNGGTGSIGSWDVSNVTDMRGIFLDAASFNQDISSWDLSSITSMYTMFGAYLATMSFNQPIGSWNVSNISNMDSVFVDNTTFNQDIGSWDVSNVTTVANMFYNASSFDQDISSWSLKHTANIVISSMLHNCGMSVENYSKWLIALANWSYDNNYTNSEFATSTGLQYNNTTYTGIGSGQYTDAVSARAYLTGTRGWTINDAGQA